MRALNSTASGSPARLGREELDDPLGVPPPVGRDELGRRLAQRLRGRGPRVVGRLGRAPHRAVEDQRGHALRVGGREQDAHRPALGDPEQRRALGSGGVHDRPHVVDPLLESRRLRDRVGQPGAALVEDDQARERGEPLEEVGERGHVPEELEVGGEAEHQDEVDRPVADDLVGDRGVAGPGVLRRRRAQLAASQRCGLATIIVSSWSSVIPPSRSAGITCSGTLRMVQSLAMPESSSCRATS